MSTRMLASTLACSAFAIILSGCAQNDRSVTEESSYTSATVHNRVCPVCGMDASSQYVAWQDGKEVDCCSRACADKFTSASPSEKSTMWNRAYSGAVASDTRPYNGTLTDTTPAPTYFPSPDAGTVITFNGQEYAQENKIDPVTGRPIEGKHFYVIADGHRVDFGNRSDAERYAAMSYEQRTAMRLGTR